MRSSSPSCRCLRPLRLFVALLLIAAMFLAFARSASAQNRNAVETLNLDQVMTMDDDGIATITIKMTLTASQFIAWQQKYGQNKSLLKRDMGKVISMYETYDWDVTEKQMDREITITVKAKGAVLNKGRGVYEFRVPKEWRGGERNGNTFSFNFVEGLGGGAVMQSNVKLVAPENASNFKEQLSEAGEKVIQFTLPTEGGKTWMLAAGLVFGLGGAGLLGMTLLAKPSPKSSSSSSSRHASSKSEPRSHKYDSHSTSGSPSTAHAAPAARSKPVDPPSMSTIPLEQTTIGTPLPDRKDAARRN